LKKQKVNMTERADINTHKLEVEVSGNNVVFFQPDKKAENTTSITFHRTLRIPDDGKVYPLPPSLGSFPIKRVDDYLDKVPEEWKSHGGIFIPMYQREAMWMSFNCPHNKPKALKIGIGKVNAVNGELWNNDLSGQKQSYVVLPDQPWLDGINAGDGLIKQFVAMRLGEGYTVEAQVTGEETVGGIQFQCFESKKDKREALFGSDDEQRSMLRRRSSTQEKKSKKKSKGMGLGAGGKIKQKVNADKYGQDFWDLNCFGRVFVHIVDSLTYKEITGENPPITQVDAQAYKQHGYPWFDLYEEHITAVAPSDTLQNVKSVSEMDKDKRLPPQQDDSTVQIPSNHVILLNK
jgi:hypothetical protein